MKKITPILALLFLSILFSCQTTGKITPGHTEPEKLTDGIEILYESNELVIAKIDLSSESVYLNWSHSENRMKTPVSPYKFAKESDCHLVINTIPFYAESKLPFSLSKIKPAGLIIENEKIQNEAIKKYSGIRFYIEENELRCRIYESQQDIPLEKTIYATGGFWQTLKENQFRNFKDIKDTRLACGTSHQGRILYILWGKKLSYLQTALLLQEYGATSAMNFDGGSSAQIVLKKNKKLKAYRELLYRNPPTVLGF